ncbi:MAG TPA: adenosine deaminase, partial [Ktedonobacteraceae bacterium]|nr:adenosine deaminase [Ktedonobacteraceae bacterium]
MERQEQIKTYLQRAPKAELHVHLEGSIQPETFLTLAKRNQINLPVSSVEEARNWFKYRDFGHFIEIFVKVSGCLKTEEDFELVAYEFGAQMARQQIRYAEVTFSASTHRFKSGIPFDVFFRGLQRGRARAQTEFGVEIRWVFDIVRAVSDGKLFEQADFTTEVALDCRSEGVVALGLGGSEKLGPGELFTSWFEKARSEGLHSTPHAGETLGPKSVWIALQQLGAERIGHGVRSIEDPTLVAHLAQQQIPLELCPWSNVRLGVYSGLYQHPLPLLYNAGVPITVNSDDPPLFNTNLNDNVLALYEPFALSLDDIDEILLNGVRQSFLEQEQKQQMEQAFRTEMHKLRT